MKTVSTGIDDFAKLINEDYLFIDKTLLIKDIIDNGNETLLFPRPRRFGKSLNMSMLRYYFDNTLDSKKLFKGLNIMKESKEYTSKMNTYPVIFLSFKELKANSYSEFTSEYKKTISKLYKQYEFLLDSNKIHYTDKDLFKKKIEIKDDDYLSSSLKDLTDMLYTFYDKQVLVLLDEYDAPIMHSKSKGYYEELIEFIKSVFSSTFKSNTSLYKGIITGVLRVSKEGMFSDANNITVFNLTDRAFSKYFGFTEEEVKNVLNAYGLSDRFVDVKKWYDGYLFGEEVIYNPWSILSYLSSIGNELKPYWVNTGNIDLIGELVYQNKASLFGKFQTLLETGKIVDVKIDLNMDLKNLDTDEDTVLTLLMLSGYLTPVKYMGESRKIDLKIPNYEVKEQLKSMNDKWFNDKYKSRDFLIKDFITGNLKDIDKHYKEIALESFSYFDTTKEKGESFYHGFTLGVLYQLGNDFKVRSNRENGLGRSDITITKKDYSLAYVIELKEAFELDDLDKEIKDAFKQIEEKKYTFDFKDYKKVYKIAIAFAGKDVKVEYK